MTRGFFRGPTSWEGYIGRLWFRWPFWAYLKIGIWPTVGWDTYTEDDEDDL